MCVSVFGDNKPSKTDESDYRSPSLSLPLCLSATAASLKFTFCNHPEVNFEAYPVGLLKLRGRDIQFSSCIYFLLVLQCVFNK